MAFITLRQLLDHAAENAYGVPAFNVNNLEQVTAVMQAAAETDAPVILQASRSARAYAGDIFLRHLVQAAVEAYPHIPVVLHQDHGTSPGVCFSAIQNGFTSVMMDGSLEADGKTPSDYAYNVRVTAEVTALAHPLGVSVEGELGCLGSLETGRGEKEDGHGFEGTLERTQLLTDPEQAVDFVSKTRVDALAVAVGTSHGAYKFSRRPTAETLSMATIAELHRRMPDLHLVMHGASSVSEELQAAFREAGGEMPETWGVPLAEIQKAITLGVRKINIDTDGRIAMIAALRGVLQGSKREFDPRKILAPARTAMQRVCVERLKAFGTAGHASRLRARRLGQMAAYYHDPAS